MTLKCVDCKKKGFKTLEALQHHAEATHSWCRTCKTGFPTQQELEQHDKALPHHCTFCYRCFHSRAALKEHRTGHTAHQQWDTNKYGQRIKGHAQNRWFGCGICPDEFPVLHQLLHHRTTLHSHVETSVVCKPVAEGLVGTSVLATDLSDITTRNPETTLPSSPIIVEQLVLDIAGHLLQPVAAAPAEHLLTPIAPPSRKYFCSPCNETIHTFPELVKHFLVAPAHASHLDRAEAQGFRCQTCHKAFSLPQDFEVHLRREKKHMRWQKATGRSTPATMGTDASSLESFQERPSSQRRTVTPVPLVERKTIMSPPLTPSPSHRGKSHSMHVSFHARVLDVDAYPTTPSAKSVVNTQRSAFTTFSTPGSGYSNGSDQVDVVDNDLEDCITYCRQCCTEFPCVEALIDHYHNDSTHRGDDIWCYTCDQAFGKAHILWPHLLRSVRHDNAPSGSRFEFSSAGYRMEGLLSGLRSSGEAPLEIDYANLKIYKKRLRLTEAVESAKRARMASS